MSMDKISALESYSGPDCDVCGDEWADALENCPGCGGQTILDLDEWLDRALAAAPPARGSELDAAVSALTERVESLLR